MEKQAKYQVVLLTNQNCTFDYKFFNNLNECKKWARDSSAKYKVEINELIANNYESLLAYRIKNNRLISAT